MRKIDLFPISVWKTKIPAECYDKQKLIREINDNYRLNPNRNRWADKSTSNLHHYYNDWENCNFKKMDDQITADLHKIYREKILECLRDSIYKPEDLRVSIVNVTASGENQNMTSHNHLIKDTEPSIISMFSAIHYLQYREYHSRTHFINPIEHELTKIYFKQVAHKIPINLQNTIYFDDCVIKTEEDDLIIFPSFLFHKFENKDSRKFNELRMTVVVNVDVEL
jgi:hypothetical protein